MSLCLKVNSNEQLIPEMTVLILQVHSFQISGKKEPLFKSKQQLNNSVDNRTQSKLFNHKSSFMFLKQDHRFTSFVSKTRSYRCHKSIPQGLSVCQTPNHVGTVFPISVIRLFVVFLHCLWLFLYHLNETSLKLINTQMMVS